MATSLFNSILSMVDSRTIGDVAQLLGQPAQAVSRGIESSVATLLSGLASKSDNPGALRQILDAAPSTGTISWSQAAHAASDPNSSLMKAGKSLLSSLFGDGGNIITNSISRSAGLTPGATTTLLTMAAPMVMGFISKHVSDTGMSMNGLAGLLQRETSTFRSALPSGLSEYFWPTKKMAATASPVIAQTVQKETTSTPSWLLPLLAAAALILGFGWLFSHLHRPIVSQVVSTPRGEASRFGVPAATPVVCALPSGVTLPAGGAEARMLAFIQDPNAKVSQDTWFNADQTQFDSGSARLKPEAQAELNNVATILTSCPNVRLKVAGYTDNVGSSDSNLRLSQSRANSVVARLVDKGVASDRLTTEGYGEQYPVADNATDQGRAQNRRVAMCIIKK